MAHWGTGIRPGLGEQWAIKPVLLSDHIPGSRQPQLVLKTEVYVVKLHSAALQHLHGLGRHDQVGVSFEVQNLEIGVRAGAEAG